VHGWPIISTWIDEAEQGATDDWSDLWQRCIAEAAAADVTFVVVFGGEKLNGALVEVGAALGAGRPVHVLDPGGALDSHSWLHHPLVTVHRSRIEAWEAVLAGGRHLEDRSPCSLCIQRGREWTLGCEANK